MSDLMTETAERTNSQSSAKNPILISVRVSSDIAHPLQCWRRGSGAVAGFGAAASGATAGDGAAALGAGGGAGAAGRCGGGATGGGGGGGAGGARSPPRRGA